MIFPEYAKSLSRLLFASSADTTGCDAEDEEKGTPTPMDDWGRVGTTGLPGCANANFSASTIIVLEEFRVG